MDSLPSKQRSCDNRSAAEQVSTAIPRTLTPDDYVAIEMVFRRREIRFQWQLIGGVSGALALSFANAFLGLRFGWSGELNTLVFVTGWLLGHMAGRRLYHRLRGPIVHSVLEVVRERVQHVSDGGSSG